MWKKVVRYEESPPPGNIRYDELMQNQEWALYHDPDWPEEWGPSVMPRDTRNIRRSAAAIRGYAMCNSWSWFGTFTLDPKLHDRTDLDQFYREFTQFIRNCRRKYGCDIEYVLVPELHPTSDGWHMHGLLQGIAVENLRPFTREEKLPMYLHKATLCGKPIYDWPDYRKKFGFTDIEPIRDRDRASNYLVKYITKAEQKTADSLEYGRHLYYVSRGLDRPQRMKIGSSPDDKPEELPSSLVTTFRSDNRYGYVEWISTPKP